MHSICRNRGNFNLCMLLKIITTTKVNNYTFVNFAAQMPGTTGIGFIVIPLHLQQNDEQHVKWHPAGSPLGHFSVLQSVSPSQPQQTKG